jgi:hypothetical protein
MRLATLISVSEFQSVAIDRPFGWSMGAWEHKTTPHREYEGCILSCATRSQLATRQIAQCSAAPTEAGAAPFAAVRYIRSWRLRRSPARGATKFRRSAERPRSGEQDAPDRARYGRNLGSGTRRKGSEDRARKANITIGDDLVAMLLRERDNHLRLTAGVPYRQLSKAALG